MYEGFEIFVVLVPLDHDRWLATSEVERNGAEGVEVFQQFGGPCEAHTADAARAAVMEDTRNKIKGLLALPTQH
jgi:hypothetical protein